MSSQAATYYLPPHSPAGPYQSRNRVFRGAGTAAYWEGRYAETIASYEHAESLELKLLYSRLLGHYRALIASLAAQAINPGRETEKLDPALPVSSR